MWRKVEDPTQMGDSGIFLKRARGERARTKG